MKTFLSLLLSTISFCCAAQTARVDVTAAEAWFAVSDELQAGKEPTAAQWGQLFGTRVYHMMIEGGAMDTVQYKQKLRAVFDPAAKGPADPDLQHHAQYKAHQVQLKQYLTYLKTEYNPSKVKKLLYPYLPAYAQADSLFPVIYYANYGEEESTGFNKIVINDLLQAYKVNNFQPELITAHEAFHAIVSELFLKKLKPGIDYNAIDFQFLYFLNIIAEEGMADLIDKNALLQEGSPYREQVKQLMANEEVLAVGYINKLDSICVQAGKSADGLRSVYGFLGNISDDLGTNGGHIPGRYMAKLMQKQGKLQQHINHIEDPVSFILTYHEAAKGTKAPVLSPEAIVFLQSLRAKLMQ